MAGRYLESKHERDRNGRFAPKIGASASTRRTDRQKLQARQRAKLSGGRLDAKQGRVRAASERIGLGRRVVTRLERRSKQRAAKRRRGKRTTR